MHPERNPMNSNEISKMFDEMFSVNEDSNENDNGVVTTQSAYFVEYSLDEEDGLYEYYVFRREDDVRILNGWDEDIEKIKLIVDALNEKDLNDNLEIVRVNWANQMANKPTVKSWSTSPVRKSIYEQLGESSYSSDTEHGD